ncbi:MAG TPA: aldo/keto reductase [Pseudonocardiaceae bacterium]|jgi:aryl-alcohol dehydrogenase (NADP+)|nr:aldo/keto reductase [Pseudonocardiaceae bacterium]
MKYTKLGTTGLEVSRICLGAMSYGEPDRGDHIWTLPLDEARPLIRAALDAGINFFDTANGYSAGTSEEILGTVLRESASRDDVVIATKVHNRMHPGPNGAGLSRKAILSEIDNSLRRLGVDHVDLYQIHRWDPTTPIEETLEALNDVVRAGKVRYLGASSMQSWQFCKALYVSRANGWAGFVSMQDHYNLLNRDEEREMFPLCADQGIGVIPWSPLARGRLTRPWGETTLRTENDALGKRLYPEVDKQIIERVGEIAEQRDLSRAQVALAWVLRNPVVSAPIIGATKPHHLADAVAAVDVELTADDVRGL